MNKFFSLLGLCKRAGKLVAGEVAAKKLKELADDNIENRTKVGEG